MKLGGVRDGVVCCTDGLDVGTWHEDRGFEPRGAFPDASTGARRRLREVLAWRSTRRLLRPVTGTYTVANVWPLRGDHLLGSTANWVYSSSDGGRSWTGVHELPPSSGPMGVHPTSVCEVDGTTYLAEYPLGDEPARVLASDDLGRTWSTFVERTDVRHFHGVFHDPYAGRLWGTTGDTDRESAVGVFADGGFEPIGRGSQRWRAVSLVFTPEYILWGMDCPYADEDAVFRLARDDLDAGDVEPDVVATAGCSVFYGETLTVDGEVWAVFTTGSAAGIDSTAPPGKRRNADSRTVIVLASSSASSFETWYELCSFERRRTLSEHTRRIPTSAAYVFLDVDPDLGFVVNPYNTRTRSGEIITIAPSELVPVEARRHAGDHAGESPVAHPGATRPSTSP